MNPVAPATRRRRFLRYAIGIDLVIIAIGVGLLLPPETDLLLPPFIAAVAVAAWRGGWKVGIATTLFSAVALLISFSSVLSPTQIALFALGSTAISTLLGVGKGDGRVALPEPGEQSAIAGSAPSAVAVDPTAPPAGRWRARVVRLVKFAGLPILVLVIYTNISEVLVSNFPIPSILQPLILFLAIPVLHDRETFRPESVLRHPLMVALTGYTLLVFASAIWAHDLSAADETFVDVIKSMMILVLTASLAVSWRGLRRALVALVAGAVLLGVLTIIQIAARNPEMQFGGLAGLDEGHLFGEMRDVRPAGPVHDPNYYARILILAFPAAALLGVGQRARSTRAAYLAAAAVIATAILLTYSRGGMLSLAFVGLLLLLAGRVKLTPTTVFAAIALLAALIPTPVGQRMLTMAAFFNPPEESKVDDSVDKRMVLLAASWRMFNDHPILGVGAGNFGDHYPEYANEVGWTGMDYTPLGLRQYPHNLYLETAVETGLVGLAVFLSALAAAFAMLLRARRALRQRGEEAHAALITAIGIGLAGYLASSLFLHSGLQRYLYLLLGLVIAATRLSAASAPELEQLEAADDAIPLLLPAHRAQN